MDYLLATPKTISKELRRLILSDPKVGLMTIESLETTARYQSDVLFKAIVCIQKVTCLSMLGRQQEYGKLIEPTYELAQLCGDEVILIEACARLGFALIALEQIDQAVYLYTKLISIEQSRGEVTNFTAFAYTNLGVIYATYGDVPKAFDYYSTAYKIIDASDSDAFDFRSLFVYLCANIAYVYFMQKDVATGERYLIECENYLEQEIAYTSKNAYKEAKLFYYYFNDEYDIFHAQFKILSDEFYSFRDFSTLIRVVKRYYKSCQKSNLDMDIAIKSIIRVIKFINEDAYYKEMRDIYLYIIDYYMSIKAYDDLEYYINQLKRIVAIYDKRVKAQYLSSINVRFDAEANKIRTRRIEESNQELLKMNEQNLEKNLEITNMYQKLQIITSIGQKITSSFDMKTVEVEVYKELKKIMPVALFAMVTYNKKYNELVSSVAYEGDEQKQPFYININNRASKIAKVYKTREIIMSNDISNDSRFAGERIQLYKGDATIRSVLYYPIIFESKSIGVLTVQSNIVGAYTQNHIDFIKTLAPFISVAMANVTNTKALKDEIFSHKITQKKLESVNEHLEELSNLDGLTHIYNRRYFNKKSEQAFKQALVQNQPVYVFMIDIDYFKGYNDAYGHLKGDHALVEVAHQIDAMFDKNNSVVARYGGEEFIVISTGHTPKDIYQKAIDVKQTIFDRNIENSASPLGLISISIGIAALSRGGALLLDLIELADDCLYIAKGNGRNTVVAAEYIN